MTQEEAKIMWPLIKAWSEGKTLEMLSSNEWYAITAPSFNIAAKNYRIRPEPKLRPWRPGEVPVGALFRWKHQPNDRNLIVANRESTHAPSAFFHGNKWHAPYDKALLNGEHSTDNGKTWQPCGVIE